jgi:hypothetical protein
MQSPPQRGCQIRQLSPVGTKLPTRDIRCTVAIQRGQTISSGCIRMTNEDIIDLVNLAAAGKWLPLVRVCQPSAACGAAEAY